MIRLTRREFLRMGALGLLGGVAVACGAPAPSAGPLNATPTVATQSPATTGGSAPSLPTKEAQGLNATGAPQGGTPLGGGTTVSITPNDAFYSVAISKRIDWLKPETYKLTVGGAVQQQLSLSLDDIKAFPAVEQMRTLECISNPVGGNLISNAVWKGIRLGDLLAKAGLAATAIEIKFTSADTYTEAIPVALATHPDSLLVYEMNGVPLPDGHGGPLRALFPGRYGMKQPKWLTSIEAIPESYTGFWERQGWSNDAIVKVNSQVRTPDEGEIITSATYPVSGTAFAPASEVSKVDISADGGKTWQEARLVRGPTPLAWVEFRYDWATPPPGPAVLIARATDGEGNQQPAATTRIMLPDASLDGVWATYRVPVTIKK